MVRRQSFSSMMCLFTIVLDGTLWHIFIETRLGVARVMKEMSDKLDTFKPTQALIASQTPDTEKVRVAMVSVALDPDTGGNTITEKGMLPFFLSLASLHEPLFLQHIQIWRPWPNSTSMDLSWSSQPISKSFLALHWWWIWMSLEVKTIKNENPKT